jgi:hypothetical protein
MCVLKNPQPECTLPLAECGFSKNVGSWEIKTLKLQKIAKASFCTPKTTSSTVPYGSHQRRGCFASPSMTIAWQRVYPLVISKFEI